MHAEDDAMRRKLIKEGNLTIHIEKVGHRLVFFFFEVIDVAHASLLVWLKGAQFSMFECYAMLA